MSKVLSIYEAKTHLSKLVKQAEAGETIYIGAYGKQQAILSPVPKKLPVKIGVWANKSQPDYNDNELINTDPAINKIFTEDSKLEL